MNTITALLGFLAALSVATERITETIKGLPGISKWLTAEASAGTTREEFRKAAIHVIAIAVGTLLAWLVKDQLPVDFPLKIKDFPTAVVFGAITSGGSAIWNSALDIAREVNKQKQLLTTQLEPAAPAVPPQRVSAGAGH
jgi:hypothetical protein